MKLFPLFCMIYSLIVSLNSYAGLFGDDSRVEARTHAPEEWREIAKSVVALIPLKAMTKVQGGYQLGGFSLQQMGMCSDIAFGEQRIVANCSGSLISDDQILTAGHCIDEINHKCENYAYVFDYASGLNEDPYFVSDEQVFFCRALLYHEFDLGFTEDLAVVELDRVVTDRNPVILNPRTLSPGEKLTMIGHPLGLLQKFVDDGIVLSVEEERLSFKHNLDTFSVNSGGPIFHQETFEQVGVLDRKSVV